MTHSRDDGGRPISTGERVLVTGGAGFIGSNLVKALVERGSCVTVLDNLSSGYRANLDAFPRVRVLVADVRDPAAVHEAMTGARVVFHLAASVGNKRSIDDPVADAETNVLGTIRVSKRPGATMSAKSSRRRQPASSAS